MKIHRFVDCASLVIAAMFTAGVLLLSGCAGWVKDRGMLVTEDGLAAAESAWNAAYTARLDYCKAHYAPRTPEATACFGEWYDADQAVGVAIQAAVMVLREYWTLRAQGKNPSYALALQRANDLLKQLPPKAYPYFVRVLGV